MDFLVLLHYLGITPPFMQLLQHDQSIILTYSFSTSVWYNEKSVLLKFQTNYPPRGKSLNKTKQKQKITISSIYVFSKIFSCMRARARFSFPISTYYPFFLFFLYVYTTILNPHNTGLCSIL